MVCRLREKAKSAFSYFRNISQLFNQKNKDYSPGLIMIQIDGLSRMQFTDALKAGRMPFMNHLLQNENYWIRSFYSGLPSSTPAVQAELFYGVKGVVPAFGFYNRELNELCSMLSARAALPIENELRKIRPGLLSDGSAYSDSFTGGAVKAMFCVTRMGFGGAWRKRLWVIPFLLCLHFLSIIKTGVLFIIELVLAIVDSFRGIIAREHLLSELKFIFARVAICVLLRELVVAGAKFDAYKGAPIIHCNFLGYDEQSHRRGPSSRFAHWTLRGIDSSVRRIFLSACHSKKRKYEVWIYSDHGQEHSIPYSKLSHKSIQKVVNEIVGKEIGKNDKKHDHSDLGIQNKRFVLLGLGLIQRFFSFSLKKSAHLPVQVTAIGPVGHVYLPSGIEKKERIKIACRLVNEAHVPLVIMCEEDKRAIAWRIDGQFMLPEQTAQVIGEDHPFLEEVKKDLVDLMFHPNSGDLVLFGWRPYQMPVSFPIENGCHAGPGREETHGFLFLPGDAPLKSKEKSFFRPSDLREAVKGYLEQKSGCGIIIMEHSSQHAGAFRVVSYDVNNCVGLDGKHNPGRLARVLALLRPDIVALQEIYVCRGKSGNMDQAARIASELGMHFHFHPSFVNGKERCGNAVLSRFPMIVVKEGLLPGANPSTTGSALWMKIRFKDSNLHLVNTQLGLGALDRSLQIDALLGKDWIEHPLCSGPLVLCGDFNLLEGSSHYVKLITKFSDIAGLETEHGKSGRTYRGVLRFDYIFINSGRLRAVGISTPRTRLTRVASDHFPLVADLEIC